MPSYPGCPEGAGGTGGGGACLLVPKDLSHRGDRVQGWRLDRVPGGQVPGLPWPLYRTNPRPLLGPSFLLWKTV